MACLVVPFVVYLFTRNTIPVAGADPETPETPREPYFFQFALLGVVTLSSFVAMLFTKGYKTSWAVHALFICAYLWLCANSLLGLANCLLVRDLGQHDRV